MAKTNLELAFPDAPPDARAAMVRAVWDNFGRSIAEFPHSHKLTIDGDDPRVVVEGGEHLTRAHAQGRGLVIVGGHFANWEVLGAAIVGLGVPCCFTYRQANNVFIDKKIVDQRARWGAPRQAPKGRTGGMMLLRALAKGDAVAMMNDQKFNEGVPTRFFGQMVMTADGPARLARRFACPIVPVSARRIDGARFVVTFAPPLDPPLGEDENRSVAHTVQAITDWVEACVRASPEQWFWVHRRWAKSIYKASSPSEAAAAESERLANALKATLGST